jgi:hypothetical protein
MKGLAHDGKHNVSVYECVLWNPELEAAYLAGAPIQKMKCAGCDIEISVYQLTADRCKIPGHHAICQECMAYIRKEHTGKLTAAGYIRDNKLVRIH